MLTRTLASRALLLRAIKNVGENVKQTKRNAGHGTWTYRVPPPPASKRSVVLATVLGGFCWFWILYHIATEPEHIYINQRDLCSEVEKNCKKLVEINRRDLCSEVEENCKKLSGEWPYIDPSTWTDEELGVPPDDKGPLTRKK